MKDIGFVGYEPKKLFEYIDGKRAETNIFLFFFLFVFFEFRIFAIWLIQRKEYARTRRRF